MFLYDCGTCEQYEILIHYRGYYLAELCDSTKSPFVWA